MCVADKRNQKLIGDAVKSFTSKIQTISIPEPNLEALAVHYKEYLANEISVFKEEIIFDEKDQCLMELKVNAPSPDYSLLQLFLLLISERLSAKTCLRIHAKCSK